MYYVDKEVMMNWHSAKMDASLDSPLTRIQSIELLKQSSKDRVEDDAISVNDLVHFLKNMFPVEDVYISKSFLVDYLSSDKPFIPVSDKRNKSITKR